MTIDLSKLSVMLAMPTHRDMPTDTVMSLLRTVAALEANQIKYETVLQTGGSIIETSRSKLVHEFIQGDKDRLFWLDSDIKWSAESFMRVLALSTKLDVVGALYPMKEDPPTFAFNFAEPRFAADEHGCFPVNGLGLGFCCITRRVLKELYDKAPKLRFPGLSEPMPHVFRCDAHGGYFRGEDIAFFADIRELGYEIKVDPTIELGHVGSKTYTARMIDLLRKEN